MMACVASNAHLPVWDYRRSLCLLGIHTEPRRWLKRGTWMFVTLQVHGQDTDWCTFCAKLVSDNYSVFKWVMLAVALPKRLVKSTDNFMRFVL